MKLETWSLSLREQVRQNGRKMCLKPLLQIKQIIWTKLTSHILRWGAEYSHSNHHMAVVGLKIPKSHITQDLETAALIFLLLPPRNTSSFFPSQNPQLKEDQDIGFPVLKPGEFWANWDELVTPIRSKAVWLYASSHPSTIAHSSSQSSSVGEDCSTQLTLFFPSPPLIHVQTPSSPWFFLVPWPFSLTIFPHPSFWLSFPVFWSNLRFCPYEYHPENLNF